VDGSGHARIADFGLATVTQNLDSFRSASRQHGHSARWAAPEILNERGTHSKEADVFAFAMVIIEVRHGRSTGCSRTLAHCHSVSMQVFTGAVPFDSRPSLMAMLAILQGERPPRPSHPTFMEKLWRLMQRCWDPEPHLRPEVSEALQVLTLSVFVHSDDPTFNNLTALLSAVNIRPVNV